MINYTHIIIMRKKNKKEHTLVANTILEDLTTLPRLITDFLL